jgi:hypothetical protein
MNAGFLVIVVIGVLGVAFFARHHERAERARFLRRAAFTLMAIFSVFFGLFVVGETLSDPGGWEALGLVASWLLPVAAFCAIAWFGPEWAIRLFAVLIAAVIGMSIWFAVNPDGWRAFEDRHGPIRTVTVFALSVGVALLGLKRAGSAGVMLLVLGTVPILLSSLGSNLAFTSLSVASSPSVVAGVLYLTSWALTGRRAPPGTAEAEPEERAKAA